MTTLPTDRDETSTIEEHVNDHNTLHALNNDLDDHLVAADPHPVYATNSDVTTAISALIDSAPGTLDTLNELAAALGDDANFASTVTTSLAGKAASVHTHAESDVTSLVADLGAKAATVHTHAETDVTNLSSDLAAKAAAVHTHAESDVTSLVSDLAGKASTGHTHTGTAVSFTPTGTIAATNVQDAIAEVAAEAGGGGVPGEYGDGSDGVVNFDGTTTVLGLVPSAGVYTLTRDIFLDTGSQVSGSAVINTASFRIFCRGTFTIGASAVVHNDGASASGATGGALGPNGTLANANNGGNGVAGGAGSAGSASNSTGAGGAGGAGGASSGGPGTGGGVSGGGAAIAAATGAPRAVPTAFFAISGAGTARAWAGGGGGSAGTAAASSTGGGGGGGGGVLQLAVYNLVVSGLIRAAGGTGGAGTGAGTGAGGGGGGGGGALILVYHSKSGTGSTFTAATNCAGGNGGAPQGAGKTGVSGSNGRIWEIVH